MFYSCVPTVRSSTNLDFFRTKNIKSIGRLKGEFKIEANEFLFRGFLVELNEKIIWFKKIVYYENASLSTTFPDVELP